MRMIKKYFLRQTFIIRRGFYDFIFYRTSYLTNI